MIWFDQFSICGGDDTNDACALEDATPDMIIAEVRRVIDTYGKYNKAFAMFGFSLASDPEIVGRNMV